MADTPQEIPFLSILQHLLKIDPKEPVSDIVWDTAETLVHRATLLETREDAAKLLRAPSVQVNNKLPPIFGTYELTTLEGYKRSLADDEALIYVCPFFTILSLLFKLNSWQGFVVIIL